MINYQQKINDFYETAGRALRAIWKILTLSLADNRFSLAKAVCISIEPDGIYLVCAQKIFWQIKIRSYKHYPLEDGAPPSPEQLAAAVSSFVAENKISRASFALCLPRSQAIVQQVTMPAAAAENLSGVVSFELDRFTPLSRENALYDYIVLAKDAKNIKIFLVVVRADQIQNYLDALQVRGIKVKSALISSFALKSLIDKTYPRTDAIYLSLGKGVYEYGVIQNSDLQRCVSGSLTPESDTADEIIKQINVISSEMTRLGRRPQIIIDAGSAQFQSWRDKLGSMKISNLDLDIKLDAPKQEKELSSLALGGVIDALGAGAGGINLLNRDKDTKVRTPFWLTIILAGLIAALIASRFLLPLSYEQQKLDEMDRRIRLLKPAVKKVEALKDEAALIGADIKAIDDFKKQNDITMNIIKDMADILPPHTWLTRMKITDKTVDIEGYSASATDIILKLENSRHFQKVEFASSTFRDVRQNKDRFVIKMELQNESDKNNLKTEIKDAKK